MVWMIHTKDILGNFFRLKLQQSRKCILLMTYQPKLIQKLGFIPKDNAVNTYHKIYSNHNNYSLEIDFNNQKINYGDLIISQSGTTTNFTQDENWVVLECVNRLLEKGYPPQNIVLEKIYPSGHGHSGRLDICVNDDNGQEYLLIECKTYGTEFDKEFSKIKKEGGQLLTYFKFENKANIIMLYTSKFETEEVIYRNEIIKIEDKHRTGSKKDFYDSWNKITKDNGVFDNWVTPYDFISKALTFNDLVEITEQDSSHIFNQFLEILRHNVVSDKPNAFNKIFTLFLCKVYDEKSSKPNEELKFQWLEGDDDVTFQLRLSDLYKKGMLEFLEKEVSDFSTDEFDKKYKNLDESIKQDLRKDFSKLRLEKNNEFAIKEVFDNQSFKENAKIVKEVVELLQKYKLRYNKRQQYLSDFFELLLTTGLKQESGQFFTPVPIAQFIIKSMPFDKLVNEKLDKGKKDNLIPFVMDYAAGSGHFLTESMHEMQRILDTKNPDDYIETTAKKIRNWQDDHFDWAEQYVYGIEKDYRLVKVGKVGCYLHGDGLANVILSDGLANFETKEYKGILAKTDKNFPQENKQFDVVISNPPYSVSSFKNTTTNYYNQDDFELYSKLTESSSEIECLFVERTKQLLKDDGMAGIILPSSILSNSGIYTKTREIILKYFQIIAITKLGSNTFMATKTNTVVLFLKRRNNYECLNLEKSMSQFFSNRLEVTLNGIEKPIQKYLNYAWQGIDLDDYKTLLQKTPNDLIQKHELFKEYQLKINAKDDNQKLANILKIEQEKLFYFILACPQKIVLVKTGDKKAERQFLGYRISHSRPNEGIRSIQGGKSITECTQLFDETVFDNPQKASTYIHQAFNGNVNDEIDETLKDNVSRVNLVDLMSFDRVDFEKTISLYIKKKLNIESQWQSEKLELLLETLESGKRPKGGVSEYKTGVPSLGGEHIGLNGKIKISIENIKFIPESYYKKTKRGKLKNLDIMICKDGALTGKVALFKANEIDYPQNSINEHVFLLRTNTKILQKYLFNILYLISGQALLKSNITGQAQGGLNRANLLSIKIPIPPKEIQQKIINEIEVLEKEESEAIEKINSNKLKIDNTINTLFSNYNAIKLKNKIEINTESQNPKTTYKGTMFTYVDIESMQNGKGDISFDKKVVGNNAPSRARRIAKNDSVIISTVRPHLKGFAYLENVPKDAIFSTGFAILKSKNDTKYISKLVYYYFMYSSNLMKQMEAKMPKASYPSINKTDIELLKIPLIDIKEQRKVIVLINKIEKENTNLKNKISAIPKQKEQILKKYL